MALKIKLKDESSRFISSLLLRALEDCREGDIELAQMLGLSIETMQTLASLKANQIHNIAVKYVRDLCAAEFIQIDSEKVSRIVELAANEDKQYEMADEFLRRGACKATMRALFGMHPKYFWGRRKFLRLRTIKGRLPVCSSEEQQQIYDLWLSSIKIADYNERLLYVAKHTGLFISTIYREVQKIEKIINKPLSQTKKNSICA